MTFVHSRPPVVVDASVTVELLTGDPAWRDKFEEWAADDRMLLAPGLFLGEVPDGLLPGRKLAVAEAEARLDRIAGVGIEIAERGYAGIRSALAIADKHGLTVYDALYLQLALDAEGELATLDLDLRRAAAAEEVALIN